jgi:DNA (cytosine-5)-methyltransferase 1
MAPYTCRVLDLFAGAGGLSLGFEQAGFQIAAAVEFWEPAAQTYRRNNPDVRLFQSDIRDADLKAEIKDLHAQEPFDVIIGGPPCQGYSNAGNRNPLDPRGRLYLDFYQIIKDLQPRSFVMENVKGLVSMKALPPRMLPDQEQSITSDLAAIQRFKDLKRYGAQRALDKDEAREYRTLSGSVAEKAKDIKANLVPLLPAIVDLARDAGYSVTCKVLNAKDHGSPQARERVFIVGLRNDLNLNFMFPEGGDQPCRTARDALDDLVGKPEGYLPNHDFTRHKADFVRRLHDVKPGETVYAHYSDAWWRLVPDKPARTVKENHGGVFVHYAEDRVLTPRELARLQDFPDTFVFEGTKSVVLKQVGNAVPVNLARAVAESLKECLH